MRNPRGTLAIEVCVCFKGTKQGQSLIKNKKLENGLFLFWFLFQYTYLLLSLNEMVVILFVVLTDCISNCRLFLSRVKESVYSI